MLLLPLMLMSDDRSVSSIRRTSCRFRRQRTNSSHGYIAAKPESCATLFSFHLLSSLLSLHSQLSSVHRRRNTKCILNSLNT